ncbi:MAG: 2,4-dichlorophenol 6-monooxygenase, partial [Gammaproteobacteria bacterium]
LPHAWLYDNATGAALSTLDLCGKGRFTLFTGIGGEAWADAAARVGAELDLAITVRVIGPRRTYVDHGGDWARLRETGDSGCVLTRPDQHVAWRAACLTADPAADLRRVLRTILAR